MKLQFSRSSFAFLIVFSIPLTGTVRGVLVVTQPETVTAEVGQSVTITCSFTSDSPSYSVTWSIGCNASQNLLHNPCYQRRVNISFPDAVQTPNSSKVPTYEGKTTITINNLTENDSGRFCCHITSGRKTGTVSGAGTKLEVTPRSDPPTGQQGQENLKMYIFCAVIGAEACVIVILIAVVIRKHPRGLSRSTEQNPPLDPSRLVYVEVSQKTFPKPPRPRVEMDAVTYSAVKVTNEECELY